MIGVFIYGELVSKRNMQLIIDTPIRDKVERAKLLGYQMVITTGNIYGVKPYTLGCVEGLLYYLNEDQVKTLMNYYGGNFRLSTGTAKVNGIERQVKFMLTTSHVGCLGYCDKVETERRLMSTSALYSENENERKFIVSTLQYLFPGRSVEWIASNYPYYIKWLRTAGYDAHYMLPMIQGADITREQVADALAYVFPNEDRHNVRSIVLQGKVSQPISLDAANRIASYANELYGEFVNIDCSIVATNMNVHDTPCGYADLDPYDILAKLSDFAETIPDLQERRMYMLLVLKYLDLPLVDLEDIEGQQLNAYVMNKLYINNLLEE